MSKPVYESPVQAEIGKRDTQPAKSENRTVLLQNADQLAAFGL